MISICDYLDNLTADYAQLCQRGKDGSIYGIADGKQCRKGKPIANIPEKKGVSNRDRVKSIVSKAKAIGLSEGEIKGIGGEVKSELDSGRVQGKEALKLFARKSNDLSKGKSGEDVKVKSGPYKDRSEALENSPKYNQTPGSTSNISGKSVDELRDLAKDLAKKNPHFLEDERFKFFVDGVYNKVPLQVLYEVQGFNSKPELVNSLTDLRSREGLLTREGGSNLIFYRGSTKEYTDQILGVGDRGEIHGAGKGIYGNGTYSASPPKDPSSDETRARKEAEGYVEGDTPQNSLVTFGLRKDANVAIFDSDDDFYDWEEKTIQEAKEKTGLDFLGLGEAAAALGIHAYNIPGAGNFQGELSDYWVILNRGAMVMITDEYTPL